MKKFDYVILGGGLVAGYAAQAFVEENIPTGALCIISDEKTLPYDRPPLSKGFLAGQEQKPEILINEPDFYAQHNIIVLLESPVKQVDLPAKQLHTAAETIAYDKLLIATGAGLRHLDLPGADLDHIYYLRRIGQSQQIRRAAKEADRAVVLGGSFIAMEVTAVLCQEGLATTMVFPDERVWQSFFTPRMSRFFENYYQERQVKIIKETLPSAFDGENGRVAGVHTKDGQILPADLVVAGIGVEPNTQLFSGTILDMEDGILVDEYLQTNVPDVYAAGDVARYYDVLFDKRRRVEHWDNARAQGEYAARAMTGRSGPFEHVPYFFSDVFDLTYEFWGDLEGADTIIHRGNVEEGRFSVWWLGNEQVQAAFVLNRPEEERELAQRWIRTKALVNPEALADTAHALKPFIDANARTVHKL